MSDQAARKILTVGEHMRTLRARPTQALRDELRRLSELQREEARRVIGFVGLKEFAWLVDQRPSTISHMLNDRGGQHLRFEYNAALVALAPDPAMARVLVAPAPDLEVQRRVTLTPEQKLARLEQTLAEHLGPDLRAALLDRAYRPGEEED